MPFLGIFITFLLWVLSNGNATAQIVTDSSKTIVVDSNTISKAKSDGGLESEVTYDARDSIYYDIPGKKIFLFGEAHVIYEAIDLKSDQIIIDWGKSEVTAKSSRDSLGRPVDRPVFKDGDQSFFAEEMVYNFKTKRARILKVFTQEGEGFIHAERIKQVKPGTFFFETGKYTTCNLEHPHFYFAISKSKLISNDRMITGPTQFVVEDVKTPLVLPFGIFPTKRGQRSGLLPPNPGEREGLGFFLENGGYYWHINEKVDLALRGDLYSRGSFALRGTSTYAQRYRYRGSVEMNYSNNRFNLPEDPDYRKEKNFLVQWSHKQEQAANPYGRFNANVRVGTSRFFQNTTVSTPNTLDNSFNSSITYDYTIPNSPFSLNTGITHSQNTSTRDLTVRAPQVTAVMQRVNPLKRKEGTGNRWYEQISTSYTGNAIGEFKGIDSNVLRAPGQFFDAGFSHAIPIQTNFKAFKYFSVSPSIVYTENWHFKRLLNRYSAIIDSVPAIIDINENGFFTTRDISFNASLNTTLYGQRNFRRGKLVGLRHTLYPLVGYRFTPVLVAPSNYRRSYSRTSEGRLTQYSLYDGGLLRGPNGRVSNVINFGLNNFIEAKVKSAKDSVTGLKKITLIDRFNIGTSYDLTADSFALSLVLLDLTTKIGKNFNIQAAANLDPYKRISEASEGIEYYSRSSEIREFGNAWLLSNATLTIGGSLIPTKKTNPPRFPSLMSLEQNPNQVYDFDRKYNLNASYNFSYRAPTSSVDSTQFIQTIGVGGDLALTPNWQVNVKTAYDFEAKQVGYVNIVLARQLHCWELNFQWVPVGPFKSYILTIRPKATMLQDLKLQRKRNWFDLDSQ